LTTNQSTPHHDGRIGKRKSTTHDQYESRVLTPDIFEAFVITSTPKKESNFQRVNKLKQSNNKYTLDQNKAEQMLDPIDSSIGSHQDEGNTGFIDPIDPTSNYFSDQLRFSLNRLKLR
jgi:hypothetical protein